MFHFTKRNRAAGLTAAAVLDEILKEKKLIGTSGPTQDNSECICFTEAPITELAATFLLARAVSPKQRPPYEPWGVAVTKEWLFQRGGRPVIYQAEQDYALLPPELRWRHVGYEPGTLNADTTWEREWRLQAKELPLEPANTIVIIQSADDAPLFETGFQQRENGGGYHPFPWRVVPLDLFGVHEI